MTEPEDELVVTLEILGGGLMGVAMAMIGLAWAYRRWRYLG